MESICEQLSSVNEQEFLQNTRILLSILHNIIQEPNNEGHRKLRVSSKFFFKPGILDLIKYIGFTIKNGCYVLSEGEENLKNVRTVMKEVVAKRKATGNPLGWDVPTSALRFNKVVGTSRYGDVFKGQLDGQEVAIKSLRPDASVFARESFRRELSILSNLSHSHVIHLVGATLLSEPASIILELLPHSMLNFLHHGELCDVEVFRYSRQVAMGMEYLHLQGILHCDLAARNLLMSMEGEVKISDFSFSCRESDTNSVLINNNDINTRWTAPEVLNNEKVSKYSDVWSYGILLYEFVTGGSVPYANFNNTEVRTKVIEGYRLSQPHCCLDEFYSLMMKCWGVSPEARPPFREILTLLLNPMEPLLASISTTDDRHLSRHHKITLDDSPSNEKKSSKKCKVKEPSYMAVVGKGGGLLRVYTALVNSFIPRVTMVCSKKTTMVEIVQMSLAKCGKGDLDHRSYAIALMDETHQPIKYIGPDDKAMGIKGSVSGTAQFVLCIRTPDKTLLDVIATIKQNPAYRNALDTRTRGYLVKSSPVNVKGSLKPKNCSGWQRYWCVLDGSTLVCYCNEEDEGMKQFEQYLDFRGANVTVLSEKNGTHFKVDTLTGIAETYVFSTNDKSDTLRWIEAIDSSLLLDPSPALLQVSGGAVLHTGFLYSHKFNNSSNSFNPLQPMIKIKLGTTTTSRNDNFPINYGKLWTVLKQSGDIQCMVDGKPELLFSIKDCSSIKVQNPPTMKEGSDYCIKVFIKDSVFVLRAELPTDHYDWMLAIERVLQENGKSKVFVGDKSRETGYVTLKRLMSLQNGGIRGSQLISPMIELEALQDLYDNTMLNNDRASPDGCEEKTTTEGPPVPPRGSSAPPPPLPPKDPPPLPPKRGNSLHRIRTPSVASTISNNSNLSIEFDEYISMQPQPPPSAPTSLKLSSPIHSSPHSNMCSIPSPITEGDDYMPMKGVAIDHSLRKDSIGQSSLPVPIPTPVRRTSSGKRSILLRSTSDSDSSSTNYAEVTPPLPPRGPSPRHYHTSSFNTSLTRNPSGNSINSIGSNNSNNYYPRNDRLYNSNLLETRGGRGPMLIPRSNSVIQPGSPVRVRQPEMSISDGMVVREARERYYYHNNHDMNIIGSVSSIVSSENGLDISGLSSSNSSMEDISQPLPSGWDKGYCSQTNKRFFFNSELKLSTWEYEEVLLYSKNGDKSPGKGWHSVTMKDGRVYYYNEETRSTTWNIIETRS